MTSTGAQEPSLISKWNDNSDAVLASARISRQQRLGRKIHAIVVPFLSTVLPILAVFWLLSLPLDRWGRTTYFDENAIQPGQVKTFWDWDDVHLADQWLAGIENVWNGGHGSSGERADYLCNELCKLNIPADTQEYTYTSTSPQQSGINTYAVISPPRASGTETIIISANWLSLSFPEQQDPISAVASAEEGEGHVRNESNISRRNPNLRGIAEVLTFAAFLRGQNHWAKEFVIVFGDGYADGLEAFLAAYHGTQKLGLEAQKLALAPQGVVWNALNIDYPGHSFSHLGIYYENVNGALPNQDLLNTVAHIAQWTAGVPVRLHSLSADLEPVVCPKWIPAFGCEILQRREVGEYIRGAKHLVQHAKYAALGRISGAHGVFARYRIDAVTLFAEPASGPHGFHAMGVIMESTLRSMNNLLERLHASFFFYLLPHPGWFHKIGAYLPAAILLGAGMTIRGLGLWVDAGWEAARTSPPHLQWRRRDRQSHVAAGILACCFLVSWCFYRLRQFVVMAPDNQNNHKWITNATDAVPTLMPILLAQLVVYTTSTGRTSAEDSMERLRVIMLTTAALSSIISGAFITAAAMTNFPQAVFFGFQLFVVLELGTWWTIHCARTRAPGALQSIIRLSAALSMATIGIAAYAFPRAFIWALCALSTAKITNILVRVGFTQTANLDILRELASIAIIEITMRHGMDIFLRLIAAVLGQIESEGSVVRLLVEESIMFDNRFIAQWLGVVTGLQLVGRVILHLPSSS